MSGIGKILLALAATLVFLILLYYFAFGMSGGSSPAQAAYARSGAGTSGGG